MPKRYPKYTTALLLTLLSVACVRYVKQSESIEKRISLEEKNVVVIATAEQSIFTNQILSNGKLYSLKKIAILTLIRISLF